MFTCSPRQIVGATCVLHVAICVTQRVDASRWSVGSRRSRCSRCAVSSPCDLIRPARQLASILSLPNHRGRLIGVGGDLDDLVGVRDGPDDIIGVAGSSRQQPGARHHWQDQAAHVER